MKGGTAWRRLWLVVPLAVLVLFGILRMARWEPLNAYALATGRSMLDQDLRPGWWMRPAVSRCQAAPPSPVSSPRVQARFDRLYGISALVCGDVAAGQGALQAAVEATPSDLTARLLLGASNAIAGGFSFGDVQSAGGTPGATALANLAQEAYDRGDRGQAVRWLDVSANLLDQPANFDNRTYYFAACYIYRGGGKPQASLKACERFVTINPSNEEAWYSLALTQSNLRMWPEAESSLRKAQDLEPSKIDVKEALVNVLVRQERVQDANDLFEKAQQETTVDAQAALSLTRMAMQLNRCPEAHTYFQIAETNGSELLLQQTSRLATRLQAVCP